MTKGWYSIICVNHHIGATCSHSISSLFLSRYHAPGVKTTLVAAGHTITPLFSKANLPSSWLHKFCTPSLPPHTIAKAVITAIDEQESKMIFLPFYTHFVRWVVILPSYLRDFFQWVRWTQMTMVHITKTSL